MAVRLAVVGLIIALYGYIAWQIYPQRRSERGSTEKSKSFEVALVTKDLPHVPKPPPQVVLHEFKVVFYNAANDPEFFIDGKSSQPMRYASGIATFRLAAGNYVIRAEYPARTCSATVSIPISEPTAATCIMK
jgi:hypothetical protein